MAKTSGRTRGNMPSSNPQLKGAGNTEKQTEHPGTDRYNWKTEAKAYIMTKGGFGSNEADLAISNIEAWSGNAYKHIRNFQLGRDYNLPETIKDYAKHKAEQMENFIERMPKWAGGTTYRGFDSKEKRAMFEAMDVGDTWDARSINSWSSDYMIGKRFSGGVYGVDSVILRCEKPQNGTSIKNLGGIKSEKEVITSGKCRYRCVGKSYEPDGTLIVDLEPINNGKVRKE